MGTSHGGLHMFVTVLVTNAALVAIYIVIDK